VDGVRYVMTGDLALLEQDGGISLLGRGSVSINTGGEKVFPEEVEAAVKSHPDVYDVTVVGVPDPRWGQRVAASYKLARSPPCPRVDPGALPRPHRRLQVPARCISSTSSSAHGREARLPMGTPRRAPRAVARDAGIDPVQATEVP